MHNSGMIPPSHHHHMTQSNCRNTITLKKNYRNTKRRKKKKKKKKKVFCVNTREEKKSSTRRAQGCPRACLPSSAPHPPSSLQRRRANRVNEMRWDWETPATEAEAEALQERIWDLHDKLSHAILALSACAGLPACRCRGAPNGHVVVKGQRPPKGGGHVDLAAAAAAMADARGLHAIRAALEDLEGHLHFLRVSSLTSSPLLVFLRVEKSVAR